MNKNDLIASVAERTGMSKAGAAQAVDATFEAIEGALKSVGSCIEDVVQSRIFIPNVADARAVMDYVGERFHGIDPQRTVTCSPLGAPEFKVEIEVTAYRGASKAEVEHIEISL